MFKAHKKFMIIMSIIGVFFIIAGIVAEVVFANFATSLNVLFTETKIDEATYDQALEDGYAMNVTLCEEGFVLLKNDDVLPIKNPSNINTYGLRSAHLVLNSAGSAAASTEGAATLKESLEAEGFILNDSLWNLIDKTDVNDSSTVNEGGTSGGIAELTIANYETATSFASAKSFSEYAIVTVSRYGGEGADSARTGYGDGSQSYLDLSSREIELLQKLHSEGFKVILLVNSSYAMELGKTVDENADAILWIGGVGIKGAMAIGEILSGKVNPSGRLVDTYVYDLTTSASFLSAADYKIYDTDGTKIGGYTDYAEDIYVGYKWYETAAAEGFFSGAFAKNKWNVESYEDVVQYPFGYGLSYTSFEKKISKSTYNNGVVTLEIEVKNVGETAGKEVVEIYVETPYIEGGAEKAKVSLCGFAKTDVLEKDKSQKITVEIVLEDIASWVSSANGGKGAWQLDGGEYKFYLSDNAHSWASISDGDGDKCYKVSLNETVYSGENKRESDNVAAENQLDKADTKNGGKIATLSRKNGFANASETVFNADAFKDMTIEKSGSLYETLTKSSNAKFIQTYEGEILDDLTTDAAVTYTLNDLIDKEKGYVDYNDERWTAIINSLSVDEMIKLTGTGGWSTVEIEKIGKQATTDIDGPFGLSNLIKNSVGADVKSTSYCSEVVMASTWNQELVTELGEKVGAEANATNTAGWYAPGANIHRTPFGGRNAEYFSEDAYLSGVMLASEASGVLSTGVYVYAKHFAFNDTEANRTSCQNCYMTEQTAREIYLKPFEIAVKNEKFGVTNARGQAYKLTGLMVSYMWIEEAWCGQDFSLCTTILRDEWGFKGMCITDNAAVTNWIKMANALYGGTDLQLVYKTPKLSAQVDTATAEAISALKIASKHILYTYADARTRSGMTFSQGANMWKVYHPLISIAIFGVGAVCIALAFIVPVIRSKKGNNNPNITVEE